MTWRNLAGESWGDFVEELAASLPEAALWVTIDKDVLGRAEAITNWDQGEMVAGSDHPRATPAGSPRSRIAGIDVCGDYSPPRLKDPLRAFLSWSDHPDLPPHEDDCSRR